jgi:hypothetical protein
MEKEEKKQEQDRVRVLGSGSRSSVTLIFAPEID